jgi:hypothetical protein
VQKLKLAACLCGLTAFAASQGMAALVHATDPELTGTGLGAVLTIVTAHDTGNDADGIESGCVSWNGADVLAACTAGFEGVGGDESTGASQTLTRELSEIIDLTTIADIGLVFNINEPGNDGNLDLRDLYFTVYSADGTSEIFSAFLDPETINLMNGSGSGVGQAGFLFILDDPQRTDAMLAESLAGGFDATWRVGGGFEAENFAGGPETMFVVKAPGGGSGDIGEIPEPSSMLLIGGGLLGLAFFQRRLTKR